VLGNAQATTRSITPDPTLGGTSQIFNTTGDLGLSTSIKVTDPTPHYSTPVHQLTLPGWYLDSGAKTASEPLLMCHDATPLLSVCA
jgi:hypothetical protein